jgi:hypothetical protein
MWGLSRQAWQSLGQFVVVFAGMLSEVEPPESWHTFYLIAWAPFFKSIVGALVILGLSKVGLPKAGVVK